LAGGRGGGGIARLAMLGGQNKPLPRNGWLGRHAAAGALGRSSSTGIGSFCTPRLPLVCVGIASDSYRQNPEARATESAARALHDCDETALVSRRGATELNQPTPGVLLGPRTDEGILLAGYKGPSILDAGPDGPLVTTSDTLLTVYHFAPPIQHIHHGFLRLWYVALPKTCIRHPGFTTL